MNGRHLWMDTDASGNSCYLTDCESLVRCVYFNFMQEVHCFFFFFMLTLQVVKSRICLLIRGGHIGRFDCIINPYMNVAIH